jgi:hypothetical protein
MRSLRASTRYNLQGAGQGGEEWRERKSNGEHEERDAHSFSDQTGEERMGVTEHLPPLPFPLPPSLPPFLFLLPRQSCR